MQHFYLFLAFFPLTIGGNTIFNNIHPRVLSEGEPSPTILRYIDKHGSYVEEDLTVKPEIENLEFSDHITFHLFTPKNKLIPEDILGSNIAAIKDSKYFDASKNTTFLIHGWMGNREEAHYVSVINAFNDVFDVNVFAVDWRELAGKFYTTSKAAVPGIGQATGEFINYMVETFNMDPKMFSVYGFSLGAHIAGHAGTTVKNKFGPISLVFALDAASPLFDVNDTNECVDASDAETVHSIHTEGSLLGMKTSFAHVDFYPNGGKSQPGCILDFFGSCSHNRAVEYLAESIRANRFTAYQCKDYTTYTQGKCFNNQRTLMGGFHVDKSLRGNYFLKTKSKKPYGMGDQH